MTEKKLKVLIASCFFIVFILSGCSSLHVDIAPTVDWAEVKVVEFQAPSQDSWGLTQPIKSELQSMGFRVEDENVNPDLLFSYFTQQSVDLTAESEKVLRLRSLHVQFTDPQTQNLVAAADYFYPDNAHRSEFALGVKELFAGIRQQTQEHPTTTSAAPVKMVEQQLPVAAETITSPQPEATAAETRETEKITTDIPDSTLTKMETSTPQDITPVLDKNDEKMQQAVQKTRSPWTPKFQSWGFENWGEESMDDY